MTSRTSPLLFFVVVLVVALPCASASATLVFDRGTVKPSVWIALNDGSQARKLANGSQPRIAPNGRTVVFSKVGNQRTFRPDLMAVPSDGSAAPRLLARGWRDQFTIAWSPDSTKVATVTGPELGAKRLELIDVTTGARRVVARGFFFGVSFSPTGDQLVYGRSANDRFTPRADIYRAPVAGGRAVRLTNDHRSVSPLWGPNGRIVYVRLIDAAIRRYGPKNELYLMAPDGSGRRRLTRTTVDQLLFGLSPTAWSADGTRLLAQFAGQDTSYAETVDPATGAHRPVIRAEETGLIGTDLSADGTTILGATGGFDPDSRHDVVAIPYGGGTPTVLARHAFDPDWNR